MNNPKLEATEPVWRMVIRMLEKTEQDSIISVGSIDNEDEQLVVYDDLHRLAILIPDLKLQLEKYNEQ